jgi:NAD(P)-dependent dehydrogenase (short-subunit alcohol dehydrogenase family)
LDAGEERRRRAVRLPLGDGPHGDDARAEVPLPLVEQGGDDLSGTRGGVDLREQRAQRAGRPLSAVAGDQDVAPGGPGSARIERAQVRLLVGEHAIGLVLRHGQEQLVLAVGEVVEQLALAHADVREHVFEPRAARLAAAEAKGGGLDEALAGGPTLGGELHRPTVAFLDLRVQNRGPSVAGMAQRLQGRTALITGSTSNIGRAIAEAYAAEGAHVVVSGRDERRGAETVDAVRHSGGRADFVRADLDGTPEESRRLAAAAAAVLNGRIDILVNNAGIFPPTTTTTTDAATFDQVYAVNVKAPYFLTQAVAPGMIAAGGGVIVNLGSWVARLGIASSALYASTKGAMETLTRAWSAEFGPRGIRVNGVSPGVIRPPSLDAGSAFPGEALMHGTPAGRAGHPAAIAAAAVYLASDDAAFIHGTVLDVDGGRTGVAVARS